MNPLDTPEVYHRYDPTHMLGRIASLPDQCQQAWERGRAFRFPSRYARVDSVVFLGVGGSAIGGDLVAGMAQLENRLPVTVLRDYSVPSWVGPSTLAIASSYSGNTEETLSMYQQARERKACLAVVTGGGRLLALAQEQGVPLFRVSYQGEARSAIGYSFAAPLALLSQLGLLPHQNGEVMDAAQLLRELAEGLSPVVPSAQNLAKAIAVGLQGRLPVVYGAGFLSGVARRWKTQLNENSKVWAFYEELPEAGHNSVEGFALPQGAKDAAYVVLLHSYLLHRRVSAKYAAVEDLLMQQGVAYRQLDGVGDSALAHLLSSVLLGDYVSYYLAILNGVDPASQDVIDQLKRRLTGE
ncbi:MAG: bifunctional phosphoglucose/phosphomannose isomerase [Chloroflexi bacterium]|nr:bifunctional phosphoglucose/phosphomannose isomerase [Chloroflexota bacterium]